MNKLFTIFIIFTLSFYSCKNEAEKEMTKVWKDEIVKTEIEFSNLAQEKGMNIAFLKFVANDGVLLRNNKLIKGKDSIKTFMQNSTSKGLSWKPDFVDVSASGDMGYTYGKYIFEYQDSLGNKKTSEGIFHTVWKRQADNTWKFVWD
ncbi:nuclear transport factor 2 family protein [Flavobacteriaceae bacterium SZ-1-7]|uniref:YybH family protein n=1 Tax=Tamlana sedimenti TaxID=3134126 RepID=UPI003124E3C4